jgi:hypothetical protein
LRMFVLIAPDGNLPRCIADSASVPDKAGH